MNKPAAGFDRSKWASRRQIRRGLRALEPQVPWTHLIDLDGEPTISITSGNRWGKKAEGLQRLGEIALQLGASLSNGQGLNGKTVLDLGCGEGGHSIMFAQAGASIVVGIDGRDLAVKRGRFAADILGLDSVSFMVRDVRQISPSEIGTFDITLCSGILHHIDQPEWSRFLKMVARVTNDLAIFYTHVPNDQLQAEHKLRPIEHPGGFKSAAASLLRALLRRQADQEDRLDGFLYREHKDAATGEERRAKMRASLDNSQSFWATQETIIKGLRRVGFDLVLQVHSPHVFGAKPLKDTRQIIVAKKVGPSRF